MILKKIILQKKKEIRAAQIKVPASRLIRALSTAPKIRPFGKSLVSHGPIAVIAEIKRKSPSRGLIRRNFDPEYIARRYQAAGAAALSVLTDKAFFGGSAEILKKVRRSTRLPILRKDFMISEYQILESRVMGADAVLLIAAVLTRGQLIRLSALAQSLGLAILFEIHTAAEWKKIRFLKPRFVGINNRNLKTFDVDLNVFERLAKSVSKPSFLIAESGIFSSRDVKRMQRAGAKGLLVGESLMRQKDPGRALRELLR